ncbi:TIR domain-containing protein [Hymenobacter sp. DG01]|uniref:TIR domain-containing protein n=1 Tax=Hymenobacter sp. DG01 TaxID=2584940 RepID=UPI001121CD2B|nr:nucleotide-binding protein [Hymenobacter sp. DG01]
MALNLETTQFLLSQIARANYHTFHSAVSQMIDYLKSEIKDNPVYDTYEEEAKSWRNWPVSEGISFYGGSWSLPTKLEQAKHLAYSMYNRIAHNDENWINNFAFELFMDKSLSANSLKLNQTFLGYFEKAVEDIINANPEIEEKPKKSKNDTVFIIHGHDNELKMSIQLLLNRAGVNSIVLHEQADKGRTIIDKLVEETEVAGYAIALLTPDDLTTTGNNRARQNVIMEIGYFLGKLGKSRLRMIVKGDVEIPSDLQGILYEKYDSAGAWKVKLMKEMQAVGIYVDIQAAITGF